MQHKIVTQIITKTYFLNKGEFCTSFQPTKKITVWHGKWAPDPETSNEIDKADNKQILSLVSITKYNAGEIFGRNGIYKGNFGKSMYTQTYVPLHKLYK